MHDGITGVTPSVDTRVLMKYGIRITAPVVIGLDPERAASVTRVPEFMKAGIFDIYDENAVIAIDLASHLGIGSGR